MGGRGRGGAEEGGDGKADKKRRGRKEEGNVRKGRGQPLPQYFGLEPPVLLGAK